jgi:hypothetical protein
MEILLGYLAADGVKGIVNKLQNLVFLHMAAQFQNMAS